MKMQCLRRAIRFVRTLRQRVLAGENVRARSADDCVKSAIRKWEMFYVSLTIFDRGVELLGQFYHSR
jgi:hypothetical protein